MTSGRGFALLTLIIIIALIIFGGAGWYVAKQTTTEQQIRMNENGTSQIPIIITGTFQGYDSAFTADNKKYLVGYIATDQGSHFVDLRPLVGYELTGVSAKLGIKAGDIVTVTGNRSSDGSIEAVSLVKSEDISQTPTIQVLGLDWATQGKLPQVLYQVSNLPNANVGISLVIKNDDKTIWSLEGVQSSLKSGVGVLNLNTLTKFGQSVSVPPGIYFLRLQLFQSGALVAESETFTVPTGGGR